jgi:hypothetical protein
MSEPIIPIQAEFTLPRSNTDKIKRRAAVRYRCNLATLGYLFFPQTGESVEAWVHNLSETGIGLNLSRPLAPGTPVAMRLTSTPDNLSIKIPAQVVHATQEIDGSWRIGCEFGEKLTAEMLDSLL